MKKKNLKIRFCPKCKSKNVHIDIGVTAVFGIPGKWKCRDCGFSGFIFPEKEINSKKTKGKNRK